MSEKHPILKNKTMFYFGSDNRGGIPSKNTFFKTRFFGGRALGIFLLGTLTFSACVCPTFSVAALGGYTCGDETPSEVRQKPFSSGPTFGVVQPIDDPQAFVIQSSSPRTPLSPPAQSLAQVQQNIMGTLLASVPAEAINATSVEATAAGITSGADTAGAVPKPCDLVPVYFDFDKAELRQPEMKTLLASLAGCKVSHGVALEVVGSTCDLGSKSYNEKLANSRAEAVAEVLLREGYKKVSIKADPKTAKDCLAQKDRPSYRRAVVIVEKRTQKEVVK